MPSHEAWRWIALEILEPGDGMSWEEAFGWVDEAEADELEQVITELQDEGRVRMSMRDGGYMLADDPTPSE